MRRKRVHARLHHVHDHGRHVLSGNFHTIDEPSDEAVIIFSSLHIIDIGLQNSLVLCDITHTDRVILGHHFLNRKVVGTRGEDIHRNGRSDLATLGTICIGGRCRYSISSGLLGSHHNGGNVLVVGSRAPQVADVLIAEAFEVGIQHHRGAGAHILLGSIDLKVATQLFDGELSGGLATIQGSRHSIDTGNRSGLDSVFGSSTFCSFRLGSCRSETNRTSPRVSSTLNLSGRQGSGSILADHIVTRDGDLRNVINRNGIAITDLREVDVSANRVGRSSGESVLASLVEIHRDGSGMFAGNLNAIHIPVIKSGILLTFSRSSRSRDLTTHTDIIVISSNRQGYIGRGDDIHNNTGFDFATVNSNLHFVSLITGCIGGDRHHERGTAGGVVVITGLFPSVGDVRIGPTLVVGIQHNR